MSFAVSSLFSTNEYKKSRSFCTSVSFLCLYKAISIVENKDETAKDILFVKSNSRLVKVNLKDIFYVEALKDYVVLNTQYTRYTIHSTMKDIEKKLNNGDFIRVHRSFIARIDKIQTIENQTVVLEENKKVIPIGGSYRDELLAKLNMI